MAGAGLAFYAMIGFEDSVNVAEEARDPQRNYPRRSFGGLLIAGLVYLAVSVVGEHGGADRQARGRPTARCSRSCQLGPLAVNTKLFAAIALFAVANSALINMIMASRLLYGMSVAGDRPGRVLEGAARAPHAVGRDRVHDAARDDPRLDRRPQHARPT
jgi:amino acid transporter